MRKIAFVFPGQGSQVIGMGKELAAAFPECRQVFEVAEEAYGGGLTRICFEGSEERLQQTENTQPAIVATSIAALRALERYGIQPAVVAGHSVGEYSALVAAGAMDLSDAIRLTRLRGRLMEASCADGMGGMAALMGFEPRDVESMLAGCTSQGVAQIAAINTPGQIVVAGHKRALTEVLAKAKASGAANATMLPVSGPFHSSLMQNARDGLADAIDQARLRRPRIPVVANVDARAHREPAELKALLLEQLTRPVLWQASVEEMVRQGATVFVELGAGRVLSGLIRKLNRQLSCLSIRDPESLAKTVDDFRANGYPVREPAPEGPPVDKVRGG